MSGKVRTFMRSLTRRGLIAGTTAHHMVVTKDGRGWHYHVHVVAEMPAGRMSVERDGETGEAFSPEMRAEWQRIGAEAGEHLAPLFCRPLASSGGAIVELRDDEGDAEFWKESTNEVARVIQYPMRDMAQGISAARLGNDPERVMEACREILRTAKGWKVRRMWGRWRKDCPAAVAARLAERAAAADADAADGEGKAAAVGSGAVTDLGTVKFVWKAARAGEQWARDAMRALELSAQNKGDFARRLVKYCRAAWSGEGG